MWASATQGENWSKDPSGNTVGYEGFEKRLEVEFFPPGVLTVTGERGLRALSRDELNELLRVAQCTIVSELSKDQLDSYVLSESSLFLYPYKLVLKTCGTTRLLNIVPLLLDYATRLSLKVKHCKYTRGTYFFPKQQPFPHGNFDDEMEYLEKYFGNLRGKAYVMGDVTRMQNWHIYYASAVANKVVLSVKPVYTLEICMTQLDRKMASKFYKCTGGSATEMTQLSGIADLLPGSHICDYAFDPCGYSMNGVEGSAFSTIHVTPEDGFSYASFETMGYDPEKLNLHVLVEKVMHCFRPAVFSLSVHVSAGPISGLGASSWYAPLGPSGYVCDGASWKHLPGGSLVLYHTFKESRSSCSPISTLPLLQPRENVMNSRIPVKKRHKGDPDRLVPGMIDNPLKPRISAAEEMYAIEPKIIGSTMEDLEIFLEKNILYALPHDAVTVLDFMVFQNLCRDWKTLLARVCCSYAVECNLHAVFLVLFAAFGVSFDMARKAHGNFVRDFCPLGDCIIFANLCKIALNFAKCQSRASSHLVKT